MTPLTQPSIVLKKLAVLLACAGFMLVLWVPMIADISGWKPGMPLVEKRAMAARPALPETRDAMVQFPNAFSTYYADNFGLRDVLIRTQGWWKYYLFNTGNDISQTTGVIFGKKGWFFGGGKSLDVVRCQTLFDEQKLAEITTFFSSRSEWAAARGIPFLVAVVPNSGWVYPEYLPDWLYPIHEESRLDQLIARLETIPSIRCISLKDALLEGKKQAQVFYKTDGHWTEIGAHYGAAEIARKAYEMLAITDTPVVNTPEIVPGAETALACSQFLALDNVLKEKLIEVSYTDSVKQQNIDGKDKDIAIFENTNRVNTPSILVFHDSFGGYGFDKSFPQFFSTTYFAHYLEKKFDMRLVQQYKPDAVVVLLSETRLQDYWKFDLPVVQPTVRTFRTLPWILDMSSNGNSDLVAGGGWAAPEKNGCWTNPRRGGDRSYLVFPKPKGAIFLTASCHGAVAPGLLDNQQVQVYANDVMVGEWSVGKKTAKYTAEIPKGVACKEEMLTIAFVIPTTTSAEALKRSDNRLRVGIKVVSLVLDVQK